MTTESEPTNKNEGVGRVLILDDEVAICRIICRTLLRHGFAAAADSNPETVAHTIEKGDYDVVLLDRSLGTTDGSSLVPLIRAHAPLAKILFFSGEMVDPDELRAVDGFVQKPINGKELAEILHRLL